MHMHEKPHHNTEFTHLCSLLPSVNMQQGPWITGGCARRLWNHTDWHMGDVDVFFVTDAQRAAWLAEFDQTWNHTYHKAHSHEVTGVCDLIGARSYAEPKKKHLPQAHMVMDTDNAITFDLHYQIPHDDHVKNCKLQVIKVRQAATLQELWHTFDFNICCFAADAHVVYADASAITDLHNHAITHRNSTHSKNLPLRVFKHFSQGYHVDDQLLTQAIQQIADKDVDWCNNY